MKYIVCRKCISYRLRSMLLPFDKPNCKLPTQNLSETFQLKCLHYVLQLSHENTKLKLCKSFEIHTVIHVLNHSQLRHIPNPFKFIIKHLSFRDQSRLTLDVISINIQKCRYDFMYFKLERLIFQFFFLLYSEKICLY